MNKSEPLSFCAHAMSVRLGALAHPARIAILRELGSRDACCCKDVVSRLDLAQSTVSQHLKVLVEAGFVRFSTDRRRSRYEIDRQALSGLSDALAELTAACCAPQTGEGSTDDCANKTVAP